MAVVYFPSGMTRYTDGVDQLHIEAPRVRELLQEVLARYPDLAVMLESMTVAVDGQVYHHPDYVPLTSTSEVHLVPRIAGGSTALRS